ncbi:MAG: hypothetical protein AAFO70_09455, partial [Pseudomonadota bacterium]
ITAVQFAARRVARCVVVLCDEAQAALYEDCVGIDTVLRAPVDPKALIGAIAASAREEQAEAVGQLAARAERSDETPVVEAVEDTVEEAEQGSVTPGFETTLSTVADKAAEADRQVWQRFVPLANFLYKKLAVIVLSALFITFVIYGTMIVFFMTSASWSLPFELSKGHPLVAKVERDLSVMKVRRNDMAQGLASVDAELAKMARDARDARLSIEILKQTVAEELTGQRDQQLEIKKHIARLRTVIGDFNAMNGTEGGIAKGLEDAFSRRLITRKRLNSGTLAVLETLHRIAVVQNEVSVKELDLRQVDRRIEFLTSLAAQLDQPEVRVITSAGVDLAHLATDAILAKSSLASALEGTASATERRNQIVDSKAVLDTNIANLEETPAARARFAPVVVLFAPYGNEAVTRKGEVIYSCAFQILWCREVGTVGVSVAGETTVVHPLFGKPLRGKFMEALLPDHADVTKELVHVGRKPLFF